MDDNCRHVDEREYKRENRFMISPLFCNEHGSIAFTRTSARNGVRILSDRRLICSFFNFVTKQRKNIELRLTAMHYRDPPSVTTGS